MIVLEIESIYLLVLQS